MPTQRSRAEEGDCRACVRFSAGRRRSLRRLAGMAGGLAVAGLTGFAGCGRERPAADGPVTLPLSEVPPGRRVVVKWRRQPVEVLRTGDGIRARSLVCTHFGCIVRWKEGEGVYRCPCHDGVYDAHGDVLSGPPVTPLVDVPATLSADAVIVGA